jgi:hypothetical protein
MEPYKNRFDNNYNNSAYKRYYSSSSEDLINSNKKGKLNNEIIKNDNEKVNETFNETITEKINETNNEKVNETINETNNEKVYEIFNETIETINETINETNNETINPFFLPKPKKSIFLQITEGLREYPDYELIYGFIENQMGIKLKMKHLSVYQDELIFYKKYIKNMIWVGNLQYISVKYVQKDHGWGRIYADKSLSLSLFHRPSRHAFCKKNYVDIDMENAHPMILYQKALQLRVEGLESLKTYCDDPKKIRQEIIDHYKLKDITDPESGITKKAKDQAKQLTFRLAFGGGINKWKKEYNVKQNEDLPLMKNMESCLTRLSEIINLTNPHIMQDLEKDTKFKQKTKVEKMRTVTSYFTQTWERIIQEECIAYIKRKYKRVNLIDIVPSQDGFMLLKDQLKGINLDNLLTELNEFIKKKYKMDIKWTVKPFDEAIPITPYSTMPIDVFLEDLKKGENHIARLISPVLKNNIVYSLKNWYVYNDINGLWYIENPLTMIVTQLQCYIQKEINRNRNLPKENEEAKKSINLVISSLEKWYEKVGKSSYTNQLCEYLKTSLRDDNFKNKLDKTAGKFPFKDGMLDLKSETFTKGFFNDNFITFTTQVEYLKLNPQKEKMDFIKNKFKEILNNNDEHLEYFLTVIGYSMTGDASCVKALWFCEDGTEFKDGDNGKTFIFELLKAIFPEFVIQTDFDALEANCSCAHKYIANWENARIVIANEGSENYVNAKLIKELSDGIKFRYKVMYSTTTEMDIKFKLFICSNHSFKVKKNEKGIYNRFIHMSFGSHFERFGKRVVEEPDKLLFIADEDLSNKMLENYRDEIISLIIQYGFKFYKTPVSESAKAFFHKRPAEFLKSASETKLANNPFGTWFYDNFEIKENEKISVEEISAKISYKREFNSITRSECISELKKIGIAYDKDISFKNVWKKGGIKGWCVKEDSF